MERYGGREQRRVRRKKKRKSELWGGVRKCLQEMDSERKKNERERCGEHSMKKKDREGGWDVQRACGSVWVS